MKYCFIVGIYLCSLMWNTYVSGTQCSSNGFLYATSITKTLTSPNYPSNYANNLYCQWTIRSLSGQQIRITGTVKLENSSSSGNCNYDALKLYQGRVSTSTLLSRLCGERTVRLQSTDDVVIVVFTTDSTRTYRGFNLQYREVSNCLYSLSATSLEVYTSSDGYPTGYTANSNCTWLIHGDLSTNYIQIRFREYREEYKAWDCTQQYVKIYDGTTESGSLIGQYCGAGPMTVIGSGYSVFIHQVTGNSPVGKGFKIYYSTESSVCSTGYESVQFGESEYITSLNSPYMYPNNIECSWRLNIRYCSDCVILLHVLKSDIEYSTGCTRDWVKAYDGSDDYSSTLLGRWCGRETPTYTSTGLYMYLTFHTDSSDVGTGFNISYTAVNKPTTSNHYSSAPVGAIVGGTLGALFLIAIIVVGIVCLVRKPLGKGPSGAVASRNVTYNAGQQGTTIQYPWNGGQQGYVNNVFSSTGQAMNAGVPQWGGQAFTNGGVQQACTNVGVQQACTNVGVQQALTNGGEQQALTSGSGGQTFTSQGAQQDFTVRGEQQTSPIEGEQQAITNEGEQQAFATGGEQQALVTGGEQQAFATGGEQQGFATGGGQQAFTTDSYDNIEVLTTPPDDTKNDIHL